MTAGLQGSRLYYLKVVVEYFNRRLLKSQFKDVVRLLAGAPLLEYSHSSVIALAAGIV